MILTARCEERIFMCIGKKQKLYLVIIMDKPDIKLANRILLRKEKFPGFRNPDYQGARTQIAKEKGKVNLGARPRARDEGGEESDFPFLLSPAPLSAFHAPKTSLRFPFEYLPHRR